MVGRIVDLSDPAERKTCADPTSPDPFVVGASLPPTSAIAVAKAVASSALLTLPTLCCLHS